jgi:DNA-binding NtrC family response regulator
VRELRNVLERAALLCDTDRIGVVHLPSFVPPAPTSVALPEPQRTEMGEREWLLEALQQHRFRRAETAQALGMARKTLYNKMRRYRLL